MPKFGSRLSDFTQQYEIVPGLSGAEKDDNNRMVRDFKRHFVQSKANLKVAAGAVTGDDSWLIAGKHDMEDAQARYVKDTDTTRASDISSPSEFGNWFAGAAGEAVGSLSEMVVGGGLGGLAVKGAAKEAGKRALLKSLAGGADEAAQLGAQAAAAGRVQMAGVGGAMAATTYPQLLGENALAIMGEKGALSREDAAVAAGTAVFQTALDVLPVMHTFRKLGLGDVARSGILNSTGARSKLGQIGRDLGAGMAMEGATEAAQETLKLGALEWVNANKDHFTMKEFTEVMDAFAAGAVGGLVMGSAPAVKNAWQSDKPWLGGAEDNPVVQRFNAWKENKKKAAQAAADAGDMAGFEAHVEEIKAGKAEVEKLLKSEATAATLRTDLGVKPDDEALATARAVFADNQARTGVIPGDDEIRVMAAKLRKNPELMRSYQKPLTAPEPMQAGDNTPIAADLPASDAELASYEEMLASQDAREAVNDYEGMQSLGFGDNAPIAQPRKDFGFNPDAGLEQEGDAGGLGLNLADFAKQRKGFEVEVPKEPLTPNPSPSRGEGGKSFVPTVINNPIPRVQLPGDPEGWVNTNAQFARTQADNAKLTPEIEKLFAEGFTANEVLSRIKDRLSFVDAGDEAGWVVGVRATLGIPSRMDSEGKNEFNDWLKAYKDRTEKSNEGMATALPSVEPVGAVVPASARTAAVGERGVVDTAAQPVGPDVQAATVAQSEAVQPQSPEIATGVRGGLVPVQQGQESQATVPGADVGVPAGGAPQDGQAAGVGVGGDVDQAAHMAATSPRNNLPEPTLAQKEAGNYKVGRVKLHGLDISVENPKGSQRKGVDKDGKPWSVDMQSHYGYIRGTVGKDKDHLDVFLGSEASNPNLPVFVVDQVEPTTGKFDEHKIMMGYPGEEAARAGYLANYTRDWKGLGEITQMSMGEFKGWLRSGKTKIPVSKLKMRKEIKAQFADNKIFTQRQPKQEAKKEKQDGELLGKNADGEFIYRGSNGLRYRIDVSGKVYEPATISPDGYRWRVDVEAKKPKKQLQKELADEQREDQDGGDVRQQSEPEKLGGSDSGRTREVSGVAREAEPDPVGRQKAAWKVAGASRDLVSETAKANVRQFAQDRKAGTEKKVGHKDLQVGDEFWVEEANPRAVGGKSTRSGIITGIERGKVSYDSFYMGKYSSSPKPVAASRLAGGYIMRGDDVHTVTIGATGNQEPLTPNPSPSRGEGNKIAEANPVVDVVESVFESGKKVVVLAGDAASAAALVGDGVVVAKNHGALMRKPEGVKRIVFDGVAPAKVLGNKRMKLFMDAGVQFVFVSALPVGDVAAAFEGIC